MSNIIYVSEEVLAQMTWIEEDLKVKLQGLETC